MGAAGATVNAVVRKGVVDKGVQEGATHEQTALGAFYLTSIPSVLPQQPGGVQDMATPECGFLLIEYFKLKESEKSAEAGRSL